MSETHQKAFKWIGSALDDLKEFPEDVQDVIGYALDIAQHGGKHPDAKPLRGFKGGGVLEVVDDFDGDTYRAVYTVKFAGFVYLLHAFQKKSKHLYCYITTRYRFSKKRLKAAQEDYSEQAAKEKE